MKFILILMLLATSIFAQAQVSMSGKKVFIGNLGKVDELRTGKLIELNRTSLTPKKVKLNYMISVPELVCTAYDYRTYPCGCHGRGGWGYPGPGRGGWGHPFPPYGGGYCGSCTQSTCRSTEIIYTPITKTVVVKFSDTLNANDEAEKYLLNFFNTSETGFDYSLQAPYQYTVKKFGRRFKVKL